MATSLFWAVWALQVALAVIIIRRKLYRAGQFPFFAAYTVYSIVVMILRKLVTTGSGRYYTLYWSTEVIYGFLALLALNDVFRRLHRLDYKDFKWFRFLLPSTGFIIVSVSIIEAFYNPPTHYPVPRIVSAIFWFDLGVHALEAAIPLLFLVLKPFLLPPKGKYDLGVLWGFGVSAFVTIGADAVRSHLGQGYEGWFRYGPPIGYAVATLIWLRAFYRRPQWTPATEETVDAMLDLMLRMEKRFNEVLKGLGLRRNTRYEREIGSSKSLGFANDFLFSEQRQQPSRESYGTRVDSCAVVRAIDRGHMLKPILIVRILSEMAGLLGLRAILNRAVESSERSVDEVIEPLRRIESSELTEVFNPHTDKSVNFWKFKARRPPVEFLDLLSDNAHLEQLASRTNQSPVDKEYLCSELLEKPVYFWRIDLSIRRDQRARLDLAREFIRRMHHNAVILSQWGNTEAYYLSDYVPEDPDGTSEDIMAPDPPKRSLHNPKSRRNRKLYSKVSRLRKSALTVSLASRFALSKLYLCMLWRFDKTRFLPIPRVVSLRDIAGIDLLEAYEQLKQAALELAKEYGSEFTNHLAGAM